MLFGYVLADELKIDTSVIKFTHNPCCLFNVVKNDIIKYGDKYYNDTTNNIIINVKPYTIDENKDLLIAKINKSLFTVIYYESFKSNSKDWRMYISPNIRKEKIDYIIDNLI